jgi:hypothetical protein
MGTCPGNADLDSTCPGNADLDSTCSGNADLDSTCSRNADLDSTCPGNADLDSTCITAWYGDGAVRNRRALQRGVRSAQCITGGTRPVLQDTYCTRYHRKAKEIIKNLSHHGLLSSLSSRRRRHYRTHTSPAHQTVKQSPPAGY